MRRGGGLKRQGSRLAWSSRVTAPFNKIDLVIECRKLPKKDSFSQADAFGVLWEVPNGYTGNSTTNVPSRLPSRQEHEVGRTEVVREETNPKFETTFRLDYKFHEEQTFVLRVYDEDLRYATDLKEHDYLGGCVFTLGILMGSPGSSIARPLGNERGKAHLIIVGEEIIETRKVLDFRFSGQDLLYTEGVLDKSNPYFLLERLDNEQRWEVIWKSEVIKESQSPTWDAARLPLQLLCNDDLTTPIKVTILDWNRYTTDELMGVVETSIDDLVAKARRGIPIFDVMRKRKKLFGGSKLKKAGVLKVLKATIVEIPSMLQYIKGGCEVDLMVAVDCTLANGDHQEENSLHFRGTHWLNDYQAAIHKIGTIMEHYAKHRHFSMLGFGGKINEEYKPIFPMGEGLPGARGLLKAYDQCFEHESFSLGKPAVIKPIIETAVYRAIKASRRGQVYSILCILTAGRIYDLKQSIDVICTAAEDAPISIVIIGVGDGNFEELAWLAGEDRGRLRDSRGIPIARDIVHFVPFNEFEGNASVMVSEALREIPEQFVQYFLNNGIEPNPPAPPPDFSRDEINANRRRRRNEV